jgi:FMN-dependent oxidoreductase (nitrilotriacetate monooxygenase family)
MKEIRLYSFNINAPGHSWPGLWRHPRDISLTYKDMSFWVKLAQICERGLFDGVFLADVLGPYDVYGSSPAAALKSAAQIPVNDPSYVVPAMAAATKHLGFGLSSNLSFDHPYLLARRFSTLDHLTNGRVGWNIVTGYLDSAARALGLEALKEHDSRYDQAEEFVTAAYKLWEGSWEDGAVVLDRATHTYVDPSKVHTIKHQGEHYKIDGIHICEPSPQRTPTLYQAGTSSKGRDFAARHAECVFVGGQSKNVVRDLVADIRKRAAAFGRDPYDIIIFASATVIAGGTEADANAMFDEAKAHISREGALALLSGWTGIDFSQYSDDEPLQYIKTNAIRSMVEGMTIRDPNRTWRVRDLAQFAVVGGRGIFIVGDPNQVADEMASWVSETDIDGFNLIRVVFPETLETFVDLVVPELQTRGIYKKAYAEGTLRQKLFGAKRRYLPDNHPAAAWRPRTETHTGALSRASVAAG